MLSNKMTFSLASLVMLIAFGFAFVPAALAAVTTIPTPDLSVTDVSAANGNQLELYQAIGRSGVNAAAVATQSAIDTLVNTEVISGRNIEFYIRLKTGYALLDGRGADAEVSTTNPDQRPQLHISDLAIGFYNRDGAEVAQENGINEATSIITHRNTAFPDGRNFRVTIAQGDVPAGARYMTVLLPGPVTAAEVTAAAAAVPPVTLVVGLGSFRHADPVDVRTALIDAKLLNWNAASNALRFEIVNAEPAVDDPMVVSIVRLIPTAAVGVSRFTDAAVSGPFNVRVTFTEEPNFAMDAGNIKIADLPFELENVKITAVSKGAPFYLRPDNAEGNYTDLNLPENPPDPTGRDSRYHSYLLTLTPNLITSDDAVIRVKPFNDLVIPANSFTTPSNLASALNRSVLRVRVHGGAVTDIFKANTDALAAAAAGASGVFIGGGMVIPSEGYLVLVRGTEAESGVRAVSANKYKDDDDRARADNLTDVDFKYNVAYGFAFSAAASDFQNFFRNGGTISLGYSDVALASTDKSKVTGYHGTRSDADLAGLTPPETIAAGSVVISEIMWGRDEAFDAKAANSQWIELHNPTDTDISIDEKEWALTFGGTAFGTEIDSVNNLPASGHWNMPGESGNTNPDGNQLFSDLVSASRIDATVSGSDETNWVASTDVGINLTFGHIGTPGVANRYAPVAEVPVPVPVPVPTAPVATTADIMISEIMIASNDGKLPQWIEVANVSTGEVSLMGWVVGIDNDSADADVIAPSIGIKLDGVTLDAGQVALVVSKMTNRNSGVAARTKGDANAGALDSNRIIDAKSQVNPPTDQYSLLSEMAFRISLEPPLSLAGGITNRGDVVGNLGGGWELPMSEDGRSSIIRNEMGDSGEIMGTDAAGWVLASETGLGGAYVETFYGDKDDVGTPGYDAGGALPVELSAFNAARDRLTGEVMITWATQSELNNAGFFIKRSQQKDGKFVIVNPTMIAGAGTTAERQSYTYTDATADPNVIYYYQIEDVSLDGNRQTLTRAHRLKGHIGAAGKATTTWGDLKSSRD